MKMKRVAAFLLAASLIVSTSSVNAKAADLSSEQENALNNLEEIQEMDEVSDYETEESTDVTDSLLDDSVADETEATVTFDDDDMVRVIVEMEGDSVVDKDSDATMNWFNKLRTSLMERKQDAVVEDIEDALDLDEVEVNYHYTWLVNAVSIDVPYGDLDELAQVDGVANVIREEQYEPLTDDETSTADPETYSSGNMTGSFDAWADGYTGKGTKIAIIDTGLDTDHQNFQAMDESKLTDTSATEESVASVLSSLNATSRYADANDGASLSVDQVYYNNKVAFGFNYIDKNTTIDHSADSEGDHGTHVAGIAAANEITEGEYADEAVGVAPDAQLYVMKVFGAGGGAYTSDILAALEDALVLGADVVNMSLGSTAGFSTDGDEIDAIYNKVRETKTVLCISAGNSNTTGEGNNYGYELNLASNPDNATVGSPGTYASATTVASVDNVATKAYYFSVGDDKFGYDDGSGPVNPAFNETFGGQTLSYAYVPNCGQNDSDYEGVKGKIAVIDRGVISFYVKCDKAYAAGAIGVIVANNTSGTISMDISSSTAPIPCVSVTQEAGAALKAALEENADATIFVSESQAYLPASTGNQISSYSSWGVSPDLQLEPDIAAPGGNIYSTRDGGTYGLMSGTSMASPNVAGMSALVAQYVMEKYPDVTGADRYKLINALLTSTSTPLDYEGDDTVKWSPRAEGSGMANVYNAVTAEAYLSVEGQDTAKVELYDDPEKTGTYSYNFTVTNIGDTTNYYDVDTLVETEYAVQDSYYGEYFMTQSPIELSGDFTDSEDNLVLTYDYSGDNKANSYDARQLYLAVKNQKVDSNESFRYDSNADESVDKTDVQAYLNALVGKDSAVDTSAQVFAVAPGQTETVAVSLKLDQDSKDYMDQCYENGTYVEGYTFLTALNSDGVDLSLPFLAFYGDWTQAPIFDSGYVTDEDAMYSSYLNVLFENYTTGAGVEKDVELGVNPYLDEEIDPSHYSISPNGDGMADEISDIYIGLLRNAANINVTYTNKLTGKTLFSTDCEHVSKSVYESDYGIQLPFIYSWYNDETFNFKYTFLNKEFPLLNNTKVDVTMTATLDYDKHEQNNKSNTWTETVTVDTQAPLILYHKLYQDSETGKVYLLAAYKDNVDVAATYLVYAKDGKTTYATYARGNELIEGSGLYYTIYDVTDCGSTFYLVAGDYAFNERQVKINSSYTTSNETTESTETAETTE